MFIQLHNCVVLNLVCRDPPSTTSALLRHLGLNEYDIRSFWNTAKRKIGNNTNEVTIFKHKNVAFNVEIEIRSGSSYYIPPTTFIDEFDYQETTFAKQITNLNMLYVYLKGYLNNELFIKVNGVYLLKKLIDLGEVKTVNSIRIIAKKLLDNSFTFSDLIHLNNLVNTLLRFNNELKEIMVYVPKNNVDFLRYIPPLTNRLMKRYIPQSLYK
ncbi:MAG: hypothetical protein QXN19_04040 [Sulfolobales archaeon]